MSTQTAGRTGKIPRTIGPATGSPEEAAEVVAIDTPVKPSTDGQVVWVDPATLVIGANVRIDPRTDKTFVASIRERGVLEPIVAHVDDDGRYVVLFGQRRTLAAVEAGRASVPVHLVPSPGETDRIIDQMAENDHRTALLTAERLAGFEQLTVLGLTAGQIAKRTATKRAEVDTALTVAGSALATAAAARYAFLTLDQSATLAEFETDDEVVTALVDAARTGQFDHVAQRARDRRDEQDRQDAALAVLTEAGVTVIANPHNGTAGAMTLERLERPATEAADTASHGQGGDGVEGGGEGGDEVEWVPVTADDHAGCPGHVGYVTQEWVYANGQSENDDEQDDDDYDDEDDDEDEGGIRRPAPTRQWVARFACTDPSGNGHRDKWAMSYGSGSRARVTAADMSVEEREAARAERRDVIESNKSWESSEVVRRAWLATFVTRKSAPKGSCVFVAAALAGSASVLSDYKAADVTAEVFGVTVDHYGHRPVVDLLASASEARAQVIGLGLVLAAYEAQTGRHSWRNVNPSTSAYLRFLAAHGYALSPVEERATLTTGDTTDDATGDATDDATDDQADDGTDMDVVADEDAMQASA